MRKAVIPAFLLLLGSAVLGATVLREPIARAATPFTNVIIGNTTSDPVPVQQQGTSDVNVTNTSVPVHEQGTAKVAVQGTVPVSVAAPAQPYQLEISCDFSGQSVCTNNAAAKVPDGDRFVIQTISGGANAESGVTVTDFGVGVSTGGNVASYDMTGTLVWSGSSTSLSNADARTVDLYADGGTSLSVHAVASSSSSLGHAFVSLSGYLVPTP